MLWEGYHLCGKDRVAFEWSYLESPALYSQIMSELSEKD